MIWSALHSQHSEPQWTEPLNQLEFWGKLASAHDWSHYPKKTPGGWQEPWKGQFPSLGYEKGKSQPYWLRETKNHLLSTEWTNSSVHHSLVTRGLSSKLGFKPGTFQPQTLLLGRKSLLFVRPWGLPGCLLPAFLSSLPCLLGFPPSLSPHYKSLFPQEKPAAFQKDASAPLTGSPLPPAAARTGQRWWLPCCCTAILFQNDIQQTKRTLIISNF